MALTIGELVGFIRADDSGFQRGLDAARLRMRGLQRDTDGTLRDIRGRFVSEGEAAGRGLADGIRAHAQLAAPVVRKVGAAVAAIGAGLPAVSAVTAGLLGLVAGAAAAGIAVKAFSLAAGEQWKSVQDVAKLAEDAQKAAASGAADAAEKQQAYLDALAQLPPATQATARAFIGLKGDFQQWSDSLSGTTMPVFTKGIEILRGLLPTLTPFVQAAATAFGGFLDEVAAGVKSAGFKEWAADMSAAAGPALSDFLAVIKNLAVGFGGLLQAFLPVSGGVTGGLVSMTEAFANWATGLKDSEGFGQFVDLAREGGQTFGVLATAAMQVLSALSPLIGVTAQLAVWLAQIINSMPPGVLLAIGTAWAAIALAIKTYALYTTLAATATRLWAIAQGIWNAVMMMNPIGLVIALIVGLVAIIVVAYQKSETFRNIVQTVWAAVQTAIVAAVGWIMDAISWFGELPGMIADWFGSAKDWAVRKFLELLLWLTGLDDRAAAALSGLAGALRRRAVEAGVQLVLATRQKISDAVAWVKGLPGRARSALGGLGSVLWNAGKSLIQGFIGGIISQFSRVKSTLGDLTSSLTSWKGPEDVDKRILTPAGRLVIRGFQAGIADQTPALRSQLQGLTGAVPGMTLGGMGGGSAAAGGGIAGLRIEIAGPEEVTRLIRGIVATKGGGNVQLAFGKGRG
jgi:phage-related protein